MSTRPMEEVFKRCPSKTVPASCGWAGGVVSANAIDQPDADVLS